MKVKIQKWGDSVEIRIPSHFLRLFDLKTNDEVKLQFDNDKIIIMNPKREKISLEERFDDYKGENLAKEFAWDDLKGKI